MNTDTGHLVDMQEGPFKDKLKKLAEQGYEPVPPELNHAAKVKLAGRHEAMVSLTSGGKLSRWAAKERKKKQKTKTKRRQNRHWGGH
jgi:hypothetical protein